MEYVPDNFTLEEESIMGIIEAGEKHLKLLWGGRGGVCCLSFYFFFLEEEEEEEEEWMVVYIEWGRI